MTNTNQWLLALDDENMAQVDPRVLMATICPVAPILASWQVCLPNKDDGTIDVYWYTEGNTPFATDANLDTSKTIHFIGDSDGNGWYSQEAHMMAVESVKLPADGWESSRLYLGCEEFSDPISQELLASAWKPTRSRLTAYPVMSHMVQFRNSKRTMRFEWHPSQETLSCIFMNGKDTNVMEIKGGLDSAFEIMIMTAYCINMRAAGMTVALNTDDIHDSLRSHKWAWSSADGTWQLTFENVLLTEGVDGTVEATPALYPITAVLDLEDNHFTLGEVTYNVTSLTEVMFLLSKAGYTPE